MNQLNNYFKNGALILAVVMLLAIPNLHVYSSIGSYKIASSAIAANRVHQSFAVNDYANIITEIGGIFAISREVVEYGIAHGLLSDPSSYDPSSYGYYTTRGSISKNYAKYDFSGFDN